MVDLLASGLKVRVSFWIKILLILLIKIYDLIQLDLVLMISLKTCSPGHLCPRNSVENQSWFWNEPYEEPSQGP